MDALRSFYEWWRTLGIPGWVTIPAIGIVLGLALREYVPARFRTADGRSFVRRRGNRIFDARGVEVTDPAERRRLLAEFQAFVEDQGPGAP